MQLTINVSEKSVENIIEFLNGTSDEGPCDNPYPPSSEYTEFLIALEEAYDTNKNSIFGLKHTVTEV